MKADDAYGPYDEKALEEVPRAQFPKDLALEVGAVYNIQTPAGPMPLTVKSVSDTVVVLDFNHPLAGKDLTFDVQIMKVREATKDELAEVITDQPAPPQPENCAPRAGSLYAAPSLPYTSPPVATKIFLCSDFHLGMKFAGYPDAARERLVEARFQALERAVREAGERAADLFVVAGDLFDRVSVARRDVERAARTLAGFPGRLVAVLPGNHDFLSTDGEPWRTFRDASGHSVLLLEEPRPYPLAQYDIAACLYPGPCTSKLSKKNAIGWVRAAVRPPGCGTAIGVAHGSVEGISPDLQGEYFPMTRAELREAGMEAWLLGHTHLRFPQAPGSGERLFIPGTPEPDGFDCAHEGGAWLLTVGEDGSVSADPVRTGALRFLEVHADVRSPADLEALERKLSVPDAGSLLVRARLSGRVTRGLLEEVERAPPGAGSEAPAPRPAHRRPSRGDHLRGDRRRVCRGLLPPPAALAPAGRRRPGGPGGRPRASRGGTAVIIRRLRLHPFGAFADRELAFGPGLTVVLGPNEAGKSTFFNALRHVLFLPSGLARPKAAKYVDPFLPAAGGDTVRVDLDFESGGSAWRLAKSWGASPACELRGPGGVVFTSDAAVQQSLADLLPGRPGTCTAVLMAGQEELARTIESLQAERAEAVADLSDILRAAVLETGGVSVDRFRSLLAARIQQASSNWDRERGQPRGGRGIENPWKKEVGEVLAAWYAKERVRQSLAAAREWERRLDDVNARLREASAAAAGQEAFVAAHAKAAADARERGRLEAEAGRARAEIAALTQAAAQWPGAVEKLRAASGALAELDGARGALEKERREAEQEEGAAKLREKAERVARRKRAVQEAREKLAASPRVERKALEEIRGAARVLERLQAGLEAGRLSVTVAGRTAVRVSTQEDFAAEAGQDLAAGSVLRLEAAGRIRIVHPDMEIEVRSGDADAEARVQKARAAEKRLAAALAASGAASLADAESRWSACEPLSADLAAAEKALAEELAGEPLPGFEARAAALGPVRAARPLAAVAADLARQTAEAEGKRRDLETLRGQVAGWQAEHGSPEALIGKLADARGAEKAAVEEMDRRAPLPAGFADARAFLKAWDDAVQKAQGHRASESALVADRRVLTANPPDRSSEELAADLAEADSGFESSLRRSQALERIARAAEDLAGGSDAAVTAVMRADMEKTLSAMTAERYARVEMDGAVPRALAPPGGARLGRELLSVGTRDTLALALRLVMARHLLALADGFLVMDDPLVDMDPARQRAAADVLRQFAADRQLVFFTCHPAAAEMLGGTLVEM